MRRMKALGLNSVTMYVVELPRGGRGSDSGSGQRDRFLEAAKATDMLVLFRPGPYICGEWEMGGLPAWLLRNGKAGPGSAHTKPSISLLSIAGGAR